MDLPQILVLRLMGLQLLKTMAAARSSSSFVYVDLTDPLGIWLGLSPSIVSLVELESVSELVSPALHPKISIRHVTNKRKKT